VITKGLG